MSRMTFPSSSLRLRRGVTLVELMVALVISFLLVGAAAFLYMNTRESQRGIDSAASANDVGAFAMQTLSREVMSAGFFPARWSEPGKFATIGYEYVENIPSAKGVLAYQFGIFGCKNKRFDMKSGTCVDHDGDASRGDSLVISYFTLDPGKRGQRLDCTGANAEEDEERNGKARIWGDGVSSNDDRTPTAPLMVINAFNLNSTEVQIEGRKTDTWSLSCNGNGEGAYQPLVAGVENLRFTYGMRPATGDSLSTETYVDADAVGVNWDRVMSVRVCMLVKSIDSAGAKLSDRDGGGRSYVDCDGSTVTQAATDTALYRTYTQTFGLRNHQTMTY